MATMVERMRFNVTLCDNCLSFNRIYVRIAYTEDNYRQHSQKLAQYSYGFFKIDTCISDINKFKT
jgi:hypothetical protein